MRGIDGKIALVTGAGRGIGSAIAKRLGAEGATVIVNYCGSKEKALETVEAICSLGGQAEAVCCNVADSQAVKAMIEGVKEKYDRLDILVNNAGITRDNLMLKMSEEDFNQVIATNLAGVFYGIKYASAIMLRQRSGRIISLSSVSGILGNAGQANYSASKAGIIGLTKSAAKEMAGRGITVNAIAPGFIESDMTSVLSERIREAAVTKIPMGRFGTPEDIAAAAAFLASEDGSYITGQVLSVDGGIAM